MWKPIHGYEDLYEINEDGHARRRKGFWCRSDRPLTPIVNKDNGSIRYKLHRDGSGKKHLVHRLVYEHFVGPIPEGLTINHKDGNRANNHPSNLEVATMHEQMVHAYATGLQKRAKGEARKNVAKLTDAAVKDIRSLYKPRVVTHRMLAERFGVSAICIHTVVTRKRWAHI